jgi:methionine-rich copper-binding protein CopC
VLGDRDAAPRLLVAGLLAALGVALAPTPAAAHTALIGSSPPDGSRLDQEPTLVALTFDEPIRAPAYVVVTAPDGSRLSSAAPEVLDNTVTESVTSTGQAGTYTVAYRVVSVDGHPVSGELRYTVTSGAAVPTADAAELDRRWTDYWPQGLVALGGGALIAFVFLPRWRHRD